MKNFSTSLILITTQLYNQKDVMQCITVGTQLKKTKHWFSEPRDPPVWRSLFKIKKVQEMMETSGQFEILTMGNHTLEKSIFNLT